MVPVITERPIDLVDTDWYTPENFSRLWQDDEKILYTKKAEQIYSLLYTITRMGENLELISPLKTELTSILTTYGKTIIESGALGLGNNLCYYPNGILENNRDRTTVMLEPFVFQVNQTDLSFGRIYRKVKDLLRFTDAQIRIYYNKPPKLEFGHAAILQALEQRPDTKIDASTFLFMEEALLHRKDDRQAFSTKQLQYTPVFTEKGISILDQYYRRHTDESVQPPVIPWGTRDCDERDAVNTNALLIKESCGMPVNIIKEVHELLWHSYATKTAAQYDTIRAILLEYKAAYAVKDPFIRKTFIKTKLIKEDWQPSDEMYEKYGIPV